MANFFMRRTPGAYPSQPAPPSPLTRGKAWQMPQRPAGLKPEAAPPSILIARLTSIVDMAATLEVPAELFSAHLTSVASIAAKMAAPITSLLTSTASIAAKAVSPIKDLLTSVADIAATMKDPNAGSTGNDSFTTVLLHMDGANNSTSIVDSNAGGSAHTWTCAVDAKLDTSQKEFGTASAKITANQTSNSGIHAADHADWHFGSGDFTIDCWFFVPSANPGGSMHLFYWRRAVAEGLYAAINDTTYRKMTSYVRVNGTTYSWEGSITVTDGAWHHYALVRTGNTLKMFIDGVNDGTNQTVSGAVNDSPNDFLIGNIANNSNVIGAEAWVGYIDEFRISKGIARWTSNFTPPVAAYS